MTTIGEQPQARMQLGSSVRPAPSVMLPASECTALSVTYPQDCYRRDATVLFGLGRVETGQGHGGRLKPYVELRRPQLPRIRKAKGGENGSHQRGLQPRDNAGHPAQLQEARQLHV